FPVFAAAEALSMQIQLVRSPSGRNAMSQLLNGEVDAATGSETQALLNSVADPRIRIILTLAECRYRIIARRSAGIRRIADLRGKKVAATINTSSHYYLSNASSRTVEGVRYRLRRSGRPSNAGCSARSQCRCCVDLGTSRTEFV